MSQRTFDVMVSQSSEQQLNSAFSGQNTLNSDLKDFENPLDCPVPIDVI